MSKKNKKDNGEKTEGLTVSINKFIFDNLKNLKYLLIGLVSVAVAYVAVSNYLDKKSQEVHETISNAEKLLTDKLSDIAKAAQELQDKKKSKKSKVASSFPNIFTAENFSKIESQISSLKTVLDSNKGSMSYNVSMYRLSEVYIQFGKMAEATELLNKLVNESDDDLVQAFSSLKLGTLQMDNAKYKQAIETFNKVMNFKELDYLYSYVNLKIGICYQNLGDTVEAKKHFTKNTEKYSKSKFTETSKNLLKLLNLQKKGV